MDTGNVTTTPRDDQNVFRGGSERVRSATPNDEYPAVSRSADNVRTQNPFSPLNRTNPAMIHTPMALRNKGIQPIDASTPQVTSNNKNNTENDSDGHNDVQEITDYGLGEEEDENNKDDGGVDIQPEPEKGSKKRKAGEDDLREDEKEGYDTRKHRRRTRSRWDDSTASSNDGAADKTYRSPSKFWAENNDKMSTRSNKHNV